MTLPGRPLDDADFAKLTGIPRNIALLANLRRVTSEEGKDVVGRNGCGVDYSGIIFPYFWPGQDGTREYRLRLDKPPMEQQADGSLKSRGKYLSPPGRGNLLYFAPGTEAIWLADVSTPIVITEGEKKTLSLSGLAWHGLGDSAERPRFLTIGLPGVWNWRGTTGKTVGADGSRQNVNGVIPDFRRIEWRGRKVTILFDRNVGTNPQVQLARWMLAKELRHRGALVEWFHWPPSVPELVNGIDDLIGAWGCERVSEVLADYQKSAPLSLDDQQHCTREFERVNQDHYRLTIPAIGTSFEIDRLRRERGELVGELAVRCELAGARGFDGVLSVADFNLSSARARTERAKLLAERAKITDLDWSGLFEEFCQRVLMTERRGEPAIDLRDLPKPNREANEIRVDGLVLPRHHPAILFGDGGAAKSYIGLHVAGRMAQQGLNVALFDWELAGDDHRERLERLFGQVMPPVFYARCERPLTFEADRLRRIVRENSIDYAIFDSVAFACDGPPEAAEVAAFYFRAVRQIGCGSLHIAHINKSDNSDRKPFGSTFWHNGARTTWFVEAADESPESSVLEIGLINRKANLGPLSPPLGFRITFTEDRTTFLPFDPASNSSLARKLSVRQRMGFALRRGAMTAEELAQEIDAEVETVKRIARLRKEQFMRLQDGRLALRERTAS